MTEVTLRAMTPEEFSTYRSEGIVSYAEVNVRVGRWSSAEAPHRSADAYARLFPEGADTPGILLRTALDADGSVIGRIVVALVGPSRPDEAWIYDIEVSTAHQGRGYGRALLEAAVAELAEHGVAAVGLNVFGDNAVARALYESAGFSAVSVQMRREL